MFPAFFSQGEPHGRADRRHGRPGRGPVADGAVDDLAQPERAVQRAGQPRRRHQRRALHHRAVGADRDDAGGQVSTGRPTGATWSIAVVAMLYSVYAIYASGKDAVLGGMLVMGIGFVIWGFIAPRFASDAAGCARRPKRPDRERTDDREETEHATRTIGKPSRAAEVRIAILAIAVARGAASRRWRRRRDRRHPGPGPADRQAHARLSQPTRGHFPIGTSRASAAGYSVALCQKIAEQVKARARALHAGRGVGAGHARGSLPRRAAGQDRPAVRRRRALRCRERKDVSFSIPIFPGGIGALLRADAPRGAAGRPGADGRRRGPIWRASPGADPGGQDLLGRRRHDERALAGGSDRQVPAHRQGRSGGRATTPASGGCSTAAPTSSSADRAILLDAAKRSPSARDLIVLDRQFTYEPLALAFARGDEDFRLARGPEP